MFCLKDLDCLLFVIRSIGNAGTKKSRGRKKQPSGDIVVGKKQSAGDIVTSGEGTKYEVNRLVVAKFLDDLKLEGEDADKLRKILASAWYTNLCNKCSFTPTNVSLEQDVQYFSDLDTEKDVIGVSDDKGEEDDEEEIDKYDFLGANSGQYSVGAEEEDVEEDKIVEEGIDDLATEPV